MALLDNVLVQWAALWCHQKEQLWQGVKWHLTSECGATMLRLLHLFFSGRLRCLCGWTVDVLTSQGYSPNSDHKKPQNPHLQSNYSDESFSIAFSACPSAPLCQTCAALLKCWIINVHKHFKHWRVIALKLAHWSCIWWGYCFRQQGKVLTMFFWRMTCLWKAIRWLSLSVFTPRTNTSGELLRTLVIAAWG